LYDYFIMGVAFVLGGLLSRGLFPGVLCPEDFCSVPTKNMWDPSCYFCFKSLW